MYLKWITTRPSSQIPTTIDMRKARNTTTVLFRTTLKHILNIQADYKQNVMNPCHYSMLQQTA